MQGLRHAQRTDLRAFAFDEDRLRVVHGAEGGVQRRFERLLARLDAMWIDAEDRPAMLGMGFEIEHLRRLSRQRMQQPRLAATGAAAQHDELQLLGPLLEVVHDASAIGLVSALDDLHAPADLRKNLGHRAAAATAAPAIDERIPVARHGCEACFEVVRDVARDQCRTQFARFERRYLLVQRPHACAFVVVEYRRIEGAGKPVDGEFPLAAHIDDGGVFGAGGQRLVGGNRSGAW